MSKHLVRYGRKHRLQAKKIHNLKKSWYICPACGKQTLRRRSYAYFVCRNCGAEYAGAAFAPTSKR